jgi:cysteine desulfurase/selenocysteine lyase
MKNYKDLFPVFKNNPDLNYLDSAATSLTPQSVIDKVNEYYTNYSANTGRGFYDIGARATKEYEDARKKIAKFINAEPDEIIFTSGATESVNMAAIMLLSARLLNNNSTILLSPADHHSTILPWRQVSGEIKYFEIDKNLKLDSKSNISPDLIAIALASNVTGGVVDVKELKSRFPDSLLFIDACQAVGRIKVDVKELKADMLCFSGHKMYGPHGTGVLYVKKDLLSKLQPVNLGGGIVSKVNEKEISFINGPEAFEAGTHNIEGVLGLGAAVDFINSIGIDVIYEHENSVKKFLVAELNNIDGIQLVHNTGENALGIISFFHDEIHAHDISFGLSEKNICVRAGNHCAQMLHNNYIGNKSTVRVSLGIYNNMSDAQEFINELINIVNIFQSPQKK